MCQTHISLNTFPFLEWDGAGGFACLFVVTIEGRPLVGCSFLWPCKKTKSKHVARETMVRCGHGTHPLGQCSEEPRGHTSNHS